MQRLAPDQDLQPSHAASSDAPPSARSDPADHTVSFERLMPWLLLLGGLLGAAAAFVLTVEKIALLKDPAYVPSCSINPVLSCGSIMRTSQAEVFGFPNPLIGVAAFPVVAALGAVLLTGTQLKAWLWRGVLAGTIAGTFFVHWLIFQSLYRIDALCPYCMVVWAVTVPLFWYTLLHATAIGALPFEGKTRTVVALVARNHAIVLTGWFLIVTGLILQRFWDYWSTLAPGA